MMRPIKALAARALPLAPVLTLTGQPGSPINLAWTDGTLVSTDWMTWGDPAAEVGYRIERATGSGEFAQIGQALANVVAFTDPATTAGATYRYRVVAYNAAGDSPSNIMTAGLAPPAAPTNLQAAVVAGPRINLTWIDNAANEANFVVQRSVNGAAFATVATLAANTTAYSEAALAGRTYAYRVYASNAQGRSADSNQATVTTGSVPSAPSNLVAQLQGATNVRLTFRDNASNETEFLVARRINNGAWAQLAVLPAQAGTGGTITYVDAVSTGQTYGYIVYAVNNGAVSTGSNTVSITVQGAPTPPAAPATFTGAPQLVNGVASINLQWTDSSNNETRFVIQVAANINFTGQVATFNRGANTTSWLHTNLPRGATIYYRIRAENASGVSAWVNMTPFPIVTP